ncbi:hypothetical protein FVF58_35795 [Paraburkholderia panacisoli]|uniref:histidine kinase n=1 Tax=Paraburkholderia panacisoli TaxID=2603818 RepID=A0A5B0GJY1_9BURK|nr:histidine kinase dimerization/phospho-acceptor domain-containing protein [Paraburkholderia panacisoli]KAA1003612.1 hypothetical protein FVF58_35795 [Paraburkholderia panacisoli]
MPMTHEIRTPLDSFTGSIELIAPGPMAPAQYARVVAMQVSATGLLQVVNDTMDFSKIDVDEMCLNEEWASMTDTLERIVLAHAARSIRQKVQLHASDGARNSEFPATRPAQSFADSQQSDRQCIQVHAVRKIYTEPPQISIEKIAKSRCGAPNSELV